MYKMEIDRILSHSSLYAYLPVGGVLILAVLVFAFGFKTVAEPKFEATKNLVEDNKKKKQHKNKSKVQRDSYHLIHLFIDLIKTPILLISLILSMCGVIG
jgi:hypothetical protein